MATLSDIQIKNWIKNNERFEGKADGDGLYLCYRKDFLTPQWRFRYRFAGKQRVLNFGAYPDLSLSDARKQAKAFKARVSLGFDVASEKQERKTKAVAQMNALTFAQLIDEYYEKKIAPTWKYHRTIKSRIDKDILTHLGKFAVEEVKPAHIDTMLQAIVKRDSPTIANDVLRWTKRMMDYAIKRHIIQYNPATAFTIADAGGKETARARILSQAELVTLFEVMRTANGFTQENQLTVKLLLLLAVRKGELLSAKCAEFDLDAALWRLPAEHTKTNTALVIPLSKPAIEALRVLIELSGNEWLLPARKVQTRKTPHIHENTLNVALEKLKPLMSNVENFCIHDFRRTARSHLAALGVESHIAERCLNHKLKGVEGVYNRHDYLDERRKALVLWAAFLTACENGKDWNVTPIRKQA